MNRAFLLIGLMTGSTLLAAETKIAFNELPAAVQAAAKAQTNGAEIVGASKEMERGSAVYEVETKTGGKSRDLSFDKTGKLLEVEQDVDLDSIPPAAQESLRKRASGGTIKKVESATQGSTVTYEATIRMKNGKQTEVAVNADGTPHHE